MNQRVAPLRMFTILLRRDFNDVWISAPSSMVVDSQSSLHFILSGCTSLIRILRTLVSLNPSDYLRLKTANQSCVWSETDSESPDAECVGN